MGREPQVEELAPQSPPKKHQLVVAKLTALSDLMLARASEPDVVLAQESCATRLEVEAEARFSGYAAAVG